MAECMRLQFRCVACVTLSVCVFICAVCCDLLHQMNRNEILGVCKFYSNANECKTNRTETNSMNECDRINETRMNKRTEIPMPKRNDFKFVNIWESVSRFSVCKAIFRYMYIYLVEASRELDHFETVKMSCSNPKMYFDRLICT